MFQETTVVPLVHCLCGLSVKMSETDRMEILGTCLMELCNKLPESSAEASLITETLGIMNNNDLPGNDLLIDMIV